MSQVRHVYDLLFVHKIGGAKDTVTPICSTTSFTYKDDTSESIQLLIINLLEACGIFLLHVSTFVLR